MLYDAPHNNRFTGPKSTLDDALELYEERAVDLVALDEALESLARTDGELARLVELRFFSGLSISETAGVMGVSTASVERGWRTARSLLRTGTVTSAGPDSASTRPSSVASALPRCSHSSCTRCSWRCGRISQPCSRLRAAIDSQCSASTAGAAPGAPSPYSA